MDDRTHWVDYAKAIGIVLVVYGHVARGLDTAGMYSDRSLFLLVDSVVYSFHMPLFFFLSGLFFYQTLEKRGFKGLVCSKFDVVIYPYLLWSIIQGLSEVVLSKYTNGHVSLGDVFSLLWQPRAQFWFLYVLFLVFVLCSFVYAFVSKEYFFIVFLIFAGWYVFRDSLYLNHISNLVAGNIVFFLFGVLFTRYQDRFNDLFERKLLFLLLFFLAGQYLFHGFYGLNYREWGVGLLGVSLVSILFVVYFSLWLSRWNLSFLMFIGSSSMSVYLMHILAGSGIRVVLRKVFGVDSIELHLLIGTVVGVCIPLAAHIAIKRYGLDFFLVPPKSISLVKFFSK